VALQAGQKALSQVSHACTVYGPRGKLYGLWPKATGRLPRRRAHHHHPPAKPGPGLRVWSSAAARARGKRRTRRSRQGRPRRRTELGRASPPPRQSPTEAGPGQAPSLAEKQGKRERKMPPGESARSETKNKYRANERNAGGKKSRFSAGRLREFVQRRRYWTL
jgi:hypothetical protein